jgi:hypothetical protein
MPPTWLNNTTAGISFISILAVAFASNKFFDWIWTKIFTKNNKPKVSKNGKQ